MLVYAEAAAPGIPRHIGSADGGSCHCAIRGTLRLRLARTAIGKSAGKAHTDVIKDVGYDRRRNILRRWIRNMNAMQNRAPDVHGPLASDALDSVGTPEPIPDYVALRRDAAGKRMEERREG